MKMFCSNCGKTVPDNATQCPYCGAPVARTADPYAQKDGGMPENNGESQTTAQNAQSAAEQGQSSGQNAGMPPFILSRILLFSLRSPVFFRLPPDRLANIDRPPLHMFPGCLGAHRR